MNCIASDIQSMQCQHLIRTAEKNVQLLCVYIYILVFVEGFRRWKGTFWLLNESLTFKGPAA